MGTVSAWWARNGNSPLIRVVLLLLFALTAAVVMIGDTPLYAYYFHGFVSRLSLPVEYPPLSLAPMVFIGEVAALLHGSFTFLWVYTNLIVLYFVLRATGKPLVVLAILPLAGALLGTYDVWAVLVLVWAYVLIDERPGLSWFLLGVAIALKLFPILFIPLWWQRNRKGWAYGLIPLLTFYPPAMWSVFHYQLARQAQWESSVTLLSWILDAKGMVLTHAFGSVEYFNGLSNAIGLILDGAFAALFVWIAFFKRNLPLIARMILLLSLFFLTNKVFSVQYVFWVVFLAFMYGRDLWHWAAISWLTGIDYILGDALSAPIHHYSYLPFNIMPAPFFMLADVLRLVLFIWVVVNIFRRSNAEVLAQENRVTSA